MMPRSAPLLCLLLAASAAAQPVPDTLRAPAEADSITVYGWTVDADADRLLVGARVWPPPTARSESPERADHHGTVFVYRRQPGGGWTVEGRLKADYISNEDCFSWSMDIRGDLAAVGAECEYGENPDGTFRSGAVYLFRHDGASWVREAKIYPSDVPAPWSPRYYFGQSVSLGEDCLVVGAIVSNPDNPDEDNSSGAAYIFESEGGTWSHTATLVNLDADDQINESFGATVAVAGDHMLIGAPSISSPETDRNGAVYVFERTGGGWVQTEKITAPVPVELDYFGSLLVADSEGAVVGSWTAVYPLERGAGGWESEQGLTTGDDPWAVARNGDHILTVDGGTDEGTMGHLFTRSGMHWSEATFAVSRFIAGRDEQVSLSDQQAFIGVPTFEGGQVLVYDLGQFVAGEPEAATPPPLTLSIAPNPAVRDATIRFELLQAGAVRMTAYDMLGREVARLVDGTLPAGPHTVQLTLRGLAPGAYLVRLETEGQAATRLATVVQ